MWLRQSTASQEILLGPFLDDTDGKTAETALSIANTDIKLWKEGATSEASKNSGGATHIASGRYYCVLDATDTNTLGQLEVNVHVSGALPVLRRFLVLAAVVYDALIAGTDLLDVSTTQWNGTAVGSTEVRANLINIAGAAVSTSTAQLGVNVVNAAGTAWNSGAIGASTLASDTITAAKLADNAIDRATFAADTGLQTIRSNTAQGGASTSITLDASASSTTDFYKHSSVLIVGGTGIGQYRLITAYNGTSKAATVTPAWATNPDNTSVFAILPQGIANVEAFGGTAGTSSGGRPEVNTTHVGGTSQTAKDLGAINVTTLNTLSSHDPGSTLGTSTLTQTQVTGVAYALNSASFAFNSGLDFTTTQKAATLARVTLTDTATAVTTVNGLANNVITAASIQADAITDAKVASDVTIASVTGSVGSVTNMVTANAIQISGDATAADNLEAILDGTGGVTLVASAFTLTTPITANAIQISGDATAADNAESFFDGTGYAGTNNVIPSVTTVTGNVNGNVGGNLTGTIGGLTAAALKDFFDTDSTTTYASAVAGSVVKEIVDNAAGGSIPTVGEIADAVWDEPTAGHTISGTFGEQLKTDVDAILADTNELQTDWVNGGRLDNILDARASQTSVDTIDGIVDAIHVDTAEIGTAGAGLTNIPWNPSWDAEVQSEVDDALIAKGLDHLVFASVAGTDIADNSIFARLVSKSATADWDTFNQTTDSLEALRDRGDAAWITATGFSTHTAADVWAVTTRRLTDATNITSTGGTITVSSGQVTVGTNNDKTGYSLTQAFPTNFASLGINASGHVSRVTLVDTLTTYTGNTVQTGDAYARLGAPAGASVSADVAAVKTDTGNLVTRITSTLFTGITSLAQWLGAMAGKQTGNITARTEIRATGAGSGTFDETTDSQEAIRDRGDSSWTTATGFSTHSASDVWAVGTRVLTAGTNIVLAKGTGITGFNDLSAAQVNAEADQALADYDGPTNAEMVARTLVSASYATAASQTAIETDTQDIQSRIPAALDGNGNIQANAETVGGQQLVQTAGKLWTKDSDGNDFSVDAIQNAILDDAIANHLGAGSVGDAIFVAATRAVSSLDEAGVRTAVGLASANLDTQLSAIKADTAAILLDTGTDGVVVASGSKTGYALAATGLNSVLVDGKTLPAALQIIAASTSGLVSGAGTATEVFTGLDGTTVRMTVSADASGNRTAVVYG